MKLVRRFRWEMREHKRSADNAPAVSFGARVGYWPCLRAPFVSLSCWRWVIELWHGYPSAALVAKGE